MPWHFCESTSLGVFCPPLPFGGSVAMEVGFAAAGVAMSAGTGASFLAAFSGGRASGQVGLQAQAAFSGLGGVVAGVALGLAALVLLGLRMYGVGVLLVVAAAAAAASTFALRRRGVEALASARRMLWGSAGAAAIAGFLLLGSVVHAAGA